MNRFTLGFDYEKTLQENGYQPHKHDEWVKPVTLNTRYHVHKTGDVFDIHFDTGKHQGTSRFNKIKDEIYNLTYSPISAFQKKVMRENAIKAHWGSVESNERKEWQRIKEKWWYKLFTKI